MAAAALLLLPTAAVATDEDVQLWTGVSATGRLGGGVFAAIDAVARFDRSIDRLGTTQVRPMLGVEVDRNVSVAFGYAYTATKAASAPDIVENRVFQQLAIRLSKRPRGTLSTRVRFEQRFFNTGDDVGYRLRTQLRYQMPLRANGVAAVLSAEPFFALNTTDWGANAGLDQMRGFAGVTTPLGQSASVEAGYLGRYVRRADAVDRYDHILSTTVSFRF